MHFIIGMSEVRESLYDEDIGMSVLCIPESYAMCLSKILFLLLDTMHAFVPSNLYHLSCACADSSVRCCCSRLSCSSSWYTIRHSHRPIGNALHILQPSLMNLCAICTPNVPRPCEVCASCGIKSNSPTACNLEANVSFPASDLTAKPHCMLLLVLAIGSKCSLQGVIECPSCRQHLSYFTPIPDRAAPRTPTIERLYWR